MNNKNALPPQALAGLEPFGRRGFLRTALIAGTTVLAGCANLLGGFGGKKAESGVLPAVDTSSAPERANADQSLSPVERAVFEKLVRVIMPLEAHGYLDAQTVPVMENIENMIRAMPPQLRDRLNLALNAFDAAAILVSFKFRRFSMLSDTEALAYINSWHEGTFIQRGAMTSLKVIVCVNYWRDQRAAAKIDYDGPVTEKWGVPRLGNQLLPRA